jgi:hypothetical protein
VLYVHGLGQETAWNDAAARDDQHSLKIELELGQQVIN